jgi:AcrR family transcriptional regulator
MSDGTYRASEFARIAGVTVRTLHHYERVGLLSPKRTDSGYRLYAAAARQRYRRRSADLETYIAGGTPAPAHLLERIITVVDMQNDPEAWKQQYGELVAQKIDRLRSLTPDALVALRQQWRELVSEIRSVLGADPSSPQAQALGVRWNSLLAQLMGAPIDPDALRTHHAGRPWTPSMATFVDKEVWDYMGQVLQSQ